MPESSPVPSRYASTQVTGGILAGGRATRMGGVDKGLVMLAGRAMIEYVLDSLRPQTGQVLINANRSLEQYARYGAPVISDQQEGFLGPLAGIASMMGAARTPWLLTSPCDSPQVPQDLGPRLWQAVHDERADIGVAHSGERLQPVFALIRCTLLSNLQRYLESGQRKIDRWYLQHRLAVIDFSDCPDMFVNVNTLGERDDLAARLTPPAPDR